jgi:hypothetical protein
MKATADYTIVRNPDEYYNLFKVFKIDEIQQQNDIYKSYPIVFSSLFDQSSKFADYSASRMFNVKHYANIILVNEHAQKLFSQHTDEEKTLK